MAREFEDKTLCFIEKSLFDNRPPKIKRVYVIKETEKTATVRELDGFFANMTHCYLKTNPDWTRLRETVEEAIDVFTTQMQSNIASLKAKIKAYEFQIEEARKL